jgi:8-oxo-dGTP pyrophosphatase MutT (NUDIX family)
MNSIANILKNNCLPSNKAHKLMKPDGRRVDRGFLQSNPIQSAVLLLLIEGRKPNNHSLVFIKRALSNGVHSGQIAFPGGRFEEQDYSLEETALRETREETGIEAYIEIIGGLSKLYVPQSNFLIHPFVGVAKGSVVFVPNKDEVQLVFTENLTHFVLPSSRDTYYNYRAGQIFRAPCFVSNGYAIWGATAMILNEFLVILQNGGYFTNKK